MASHTQNERYLRDGAVLIYQRTDVAKPLWHCRIKFADHPYIRKSRTLIARDEADNYVFRLVALMNFWRYGYSEDELQMLDGHVFSMPENGGAIIPH